MPRQSGSFSEIPVFGPDGCIAWGIAPVDMRSRPAILVRMIRALMDQPPPADAPHFRGYRNVAQASDTLLDVGFTNAQINDLGSHAIRCLTTFKAAQVLTPTSPNDAARRICGEIWAAQRRNGAWDFKDIVTLSNAGTIAFCLVDILTLVLLAYPCEAVA